MAVQVQDCLPAPVFGSPGLLHLGYYPRGRSNIPQYMCVHIQEFGQGALPCIVVDRVSAGPREHGENTAPKSERGHAYL